MQGTEACGGRGRWGQGGSPNATRPSLSVTEDAVPAWDPLCPPEFAVRSWPVVHELQMGVLTCLVCPQLGCWADPTGMGYVAQMSLFGDI